VGTGKIVATARPGNHPRRWKEAIQVRVVASPIPTGRPQLDPHLVRAVLANESCRIAVIRHRSLIARSDDKEIEGRDGMNIAVVDCGDVELLIT
jgi:hypothetical protein